MSIALAAKRCSCHGCSFEEMLRAADDEEGLLSRAAGGLANGASAGASAVVKTLLRRPRVFILGVVWETPQVRSPSCTHLGQAVAMFAAWRSLLACVFVYHMVHSTAERFYQLLRQLCFKY
jgi:hypothetical protein